MAKFTLLLFCSIAIAAALSSAAPVNAHAKPTQIPALKGTPPSIPNEHVEVLTIQEEEVQVGRTQATPTQTRMGRAASTPSKKVPHPCPGCFSVIGDPGTPPKAQ